MSTPAALALGALFDSVLQAALRQFFRRAVLEIEPGKSPRTDRPPEIEAIVDPSTLCISWAGTTYMLRMPGHVTFTSHQVRMARAIVAVVAGRYPAGPKPQLLAESGEVFRGAYKARPVGGFFGERPDFAPRSAAGGGLRALIIVEPFGA